ERNSLENGGQQILIHVILLALLSIRRGSRPHIFHWFSLYLSRWIVSRTIHSIGFPRSRRNCAFGRTGIVLSYNVRSNDCEKNRLRYNQIAMNTSKETPPKVEQDYR